jgi:DHA1 family tetracycline resistance protein-like MFS transporter
MVVFVNFLGATIVQPTLPLYAQRHFGAPEHIIPLLSTSYFIAQFIAAPFLGRLSDRYGRLPVLLGCQIGTVFSFILMGFAPSLPFLFFARILDGITGGNVIVAQAYVTDITPREQRTQALGLVFAAFGIGYTIGPAIGGVISILGEGAPFFAGALISALTVLIAWLTLDETLSPEERRNRRQADARIHLRDVLHNPALVLILLIAFFGQAGMAMVQSTFPLFGEKVIFAGSPDWMVSLGVGLLLGMMGIGQIITQVWIIPRLMPRVGERRAVIVGAVVRGFAVLALTVVTSPFLIAPLTSLPFAIGAGIMMPSLQSLATWSVDEKMLGNVLGIYRSSVSLGIIFGSAVSGQLFAAAPTLPYLAAGLLYAVTLLPGFMLLRREPTPALAAH